MDLNTSTASTPIRLTPEWLTHEYISIGLLALFVPFSLCSNMMVLLSVARFKRLQMPTNFFILSLAVADVVIALTLPFYVVTELTEVSVANVYLCLASNRMLMTAGGASMVILAVIAYDRYTAIMHPLEYTLLMTGTKIISFVTFAWLYSALVTWLPLFAGWYAGTDDPRNLCSSGVLHRESHILFISAMFAPSCFCVLYCYFRIFLVARHHATAIAAVESSLRQNLKTQFVHKDTKYAKKLAIVIGVFLCFWLPYLICLVDEIIENTKLDNWLKHYFMLLAHLNSGVNPWVYAYQNGEFRAAYRKLYRTWNCRGKRCRQRQDRRASLVSEISIMPSSSGRGRLSRTNSRVTASDILYTLSRRVGNANVDSVLTQKLGPRLGIVNSLCSLPDLLKLYIHSTPEPVLAILEESLGEHADTLKHDSIDSAFSVNDYNSASSGQE